jgi:hypothetical protein
MFKKILISITIILLLGAGYFAFITWGQDQNLSTWSFVPETATLVYESNDIHSTLEHLKDQNTWRTLTLIPEINKINTLIAQMDSTINRENAFTEALSNTQMLISLHRTGKNQFDFLVSAELSQIQSREMLSQIQSAYFEAEYRKKTREFLGESIVEVIKDGIPIYAYNIHKQFFVGSTTPYLVEDAIRIRKQENIKSFIERNKELISLVKMQQDQGNIYLNMTAIPGALRDILPAWRLNKAGKSSFLDLKINNQTITLDGFSFADKDDWLNTLDMGSGQTMNIAEVIPINSAIVRHYNFSDGASWGEKYSQYLQSNDTGVQVIRQELLSQLDLDATYTFQLLDNEIAHTISTGSGDIQQLMILEVKDMDLMTRFLDGVIERNLNKTGDSTLFENFGEYKIKALPTNQFPYALMGEFASGFEDCFFTTYRNYLLISDHLPYLKQSLSDIEEENTWRKSLRMSNFLDNLNQESSYSLFVNVPSTIRSVVGGLDPRWRNLITQNDFVIKTFENIAIQISPVDEKFYTSVYIDQSNGNIRSEVTPIAKSTLDLGVKINSKPILLKDHTQNERSILLQDSTDQIYWVTHDFKVEWTKPLEGPISGEIHSLDYYKNGKLQYAFVTPNQIHMIDREGNYLPGYPKSMKGSDSLKYLTVVDYDGDKNYRLVIADRQGQIFITNKEGTSLAGWQPKKLNDPLVDAPKHYRISNKDLFLMATKEGKIHVFNRRANYYPGFPVSLNEFLSSNIYFNPASSFGSSYFTVLTDNGNLQSFDLQSNSKDFNQLYKPEPETQFSILKSVSDESYLILRNSNERIDFLNSNLELLFGKDYLDDESIFVQYYSINPSKQYIVIGNYNGQFIYMYDLTGRLITSRPLIGNQPVSLMYYEKTDEEIIYLINGSELSQFKLKK